MTIRMAGVLSVLVILAGCTEMKPTDFSGKTPRLVIEEYFAGRTVASGIFEDRFGQVRRQFTVEIDGNWNGEELILDERFLYDDGERERRIWRIRKNGPNAYEGRAGDVIGVATGEAQGNALNWQYEMDLKVGDGSWRVRFDDWMFLQSSGLLLNRARVSKFGLEIGTVMLAFMKPSAEASSADVAFNEWQSDGVSLRAANQ